MLTTQKLRAPPPELIGVIVYWQQVRSSAGNREYKNGLTRVLYIAGWGRSGSTILDNVLGQVEGFFSTGELRSIWDRGLIENWLCSCGAAFRDCEVWKSVFTEAFGGFEGVDVRRMLAIRDRYDRPWNTFFPRRLRSSELAEYRAALTRLYAAIAAVSGAKVIVDSSKTPAYCRILQDCAGIEVDVVHLLRDSRAVAFSWQRKRLWGNNEGGYMSRFVPAVSSLIWDGRQVASEALGRGAPGRYLRLRYEDFVAAPQHALARILALTGGGSALPAFCGDRKVALRPVHGISGNPSRFARGAVELRPDEEWRSAMKWTDRLIVTAMTAPLLMRYRYPLTTRTSAAG